MNFLLAAEGNFLLTCPLEPWTAGLHYGTPSKGVVSQLLDYWRMSIAPVAWSAVTDGSQQLVEVQYLPLFVFSSCCVLEIRLIRQN